MTIDQLSQRRRIHLGYFLLAGFIFAIFSALHAAPSAPAVSRWFSGRHASGDWFGARDSLERSGVDVHGYWKGTFYGLTGGGLDAPRGAFDEELRLGITLDFGKIAGIEGLTADGSVRWRDGRNPNEIVGASSNFNPSKYQSGQQWRLMPFYLTYTTPELFGVKKLLTLSGGWQNPYDFFADQPESKLFVNNSVSTTKGIGGVDGFPWSSSYAAWGGYLKIRPTEWVYAMAGLYLAIPEATEMANHGLDFAGYGPDPNRNGLYFLGETGILPKLGPSSLPGKYAFGTIYWGLENTAFCGQSYDQKYTFNWQADQMIFREPEAEPLPGGTSKDGRSFKEIKESAACEQGLHAFAFFNYAPPYDNAMPFYFHGGLVYKGLIPSRDHDQLGVAFGYGNYSYDKIAEEEKSNEPVRQTYEAMIEVDYRVQATKFLYVQPFWQYIVRPNGAGLVRNANIFGVHMAVTF